MLLEVLTLNGKTVVSICWTSWITFIIFLIGGFDLLIISLTCLMVLDFLSGLMVGYNSKTLNSRKAVAGIKKKIMIYVIIATATIMDRLIPGVGIRNVVGLFYCTIEILSVIENAGKLGLPIPKKLKQALEQCNDNEGKCLKCCSKNKENK